MIIHSQVTEKYPRFHRIRCFDCQVDIRSKALLKRHRGHEVHYIGLDGQIED